MKTIVAAAAFATFVAAQANDGDAIDRLDKYLIAYEPQLSSLVADETMRQEVRGNAQFRLEKRIESEVAFIALPQNVGWLGFRHVKTVDNRPVALADASLTVALGTPGLERARTLLEESAHHNLGLPRTTNLPNLPLEFFIVATASGCWPAPTARKRSVESGPRVSSFSSG